MKRFFVIFFVIVFTQNLCYAAEYNQIDCDSIKVEYQIYNNDTIYHKRYFSSNDIFTFSTLKQYEEELFLKYHTLHNKMNLPDLIEQFNNDNNNRVAFVKFIIRTFLDGYGKKRCREIIENQSPQIAIHICIDIEGNIIDLNFNYDHTFAKFMTPEDIVHNTRILQSSALNTFFAEYAEMGVKILPPLSIPINKTFIEEYLKEQ